MNTFNHETVEIWRGEDWRDNFNDDGECVSTTIVVFWAVMRGGEDILMSYDTLDEACKAYPGANVVLNPAVERRTS